MLEEIKFSQFGGMNTVVDSSNQGVSGSRLVRNFLLRPLGALGVPPAWSRFAPGGTNVDLAFATNIAYLFDSGAGLYFQSPDDTWWNASVNADGSQLNEPVTWTGATRSANLVLTSGQKLVFKFSSTLAWSLSANEANAGDFTERSPVPPYYGTRYTSVQAFAKTYGIRIPDGNGNTWHLSANDDLGFYAVTV